MRAKKNHCKHCGAVCCHKRTTCGNCAHGAIKLSTGKIIRPIFRKAA